MRLLPLAGAGLQESHADTGGPSLARRCLRGTLLA